MLMKLVKVFSTYVTKLPHPLQVKCCACLRSLAGLVTGALTDLVPAVLSKSAPDPPAGPPAVQYNLLNKHIGVSSQCNMAHAL